jgi:hypothetical protein
MWQMGLKHGFGVYQNGQIAYEGDFSQDKRCGIGKLTLKVPDIELLKYEG